MRDVVLFVAVIAGAVVLGVVGDGERWLDDQTGLVVLLYLVTVFAVIVAVADARSHRRR